MSFKKLFISSIQVKFSLGLKLHVLKYLEINILQMRFMVKDIVVWIGSKEARIYSMNESGDGKTIVKKSDLDHHSRHKNDLRVESHEDSYFKELADKLKYTDQLLLIGAGFAKNRFKVYLEAHQTNTLAKKIIGMEKMESFEHKTTGQMMHRARKFFKTYNLIVGFFCIF